MLLHARHVGETVTAEARTTLKGNLYAYLTSITSHVQHPQIVIY